MSLDANISMKVDVLSIPSVSETYPEEECIADHRRCRLKETQEVLASSICYPWIFRTANKVFLSLVLLV
jgi:hypothetical protein